MVINYIQYVHLISSETSFMAFPPIYTFLTVGKYIQNIYSPKPSIHGYQLDPFYSFLDIVDESSLEFM